MPLFVAIVRAITYRPPIVAARSSSRSFQEKLTTTLSTTMVGTSVEKRRSKRIPTKRNLFRPGKTNESMNSSSKFFVCPDRGCSEENLYPRTNNGKGIDRDKTVNCSKCGIPITFTAGEDGLRATAASRPASKGAPLKRQTGSNKRPAPPIASLATPTKRQAVVPPPTPNLSGPMASMKISWKLRPHSKTTGSSPDDSEVEAALPEGAYLFMGNSNIQCSNILFCQPK